MKCYSCNKALLLNEEVQRLPRPDIVAQGGKSGVPGLYPHPDFSEDEGEVVIHSKCAPAFFDPESNPLLFDEYAARIREAVTHDIYAEAEDHFQNHCTKCGDILDDEELYAEEPPCLWCKTSIPVWSKTSPRHGLVYYCGQCQRCWNEFEEEVEFPTS